MEPDRSAPAARRDWTRIALVASLCCNVAIVGLIAGLWIKGPPPAGPGAEFGLWRYGAALPEPYRHDLGRSLHENRTRWEGRREALRGQRLALADALTAEPYDPGAIATLLRAEQEVLSDLAGRGSALLLAQIGRMSPEERRAYAEALRRRPDRRGKGRRP
jgi:uncharacterized membrane protein